MRKDTDNTLMGGSSFTNTKNWRPLREINPVDTTIDQITQLQKRVLVDGAPSAQTPEMADPGTAPLAVSGVTATESPYKTTNRQLTSLVGVTFTPNVNDQNFAGVEIWFTGYNGSSSPQLMAEATTSPAQFLCETTNETVTVTVVSYNGSGLTADFTAAPTTTVLLDGVISAPPSPSISQTLVAYPLGLQFAFNQISLGGTQDIVDAYRVYRFTSNAPASATLLRTVKHDPTASGAIVVQDTVGGGATFFYWVTAVNTSGLESAKTAAQSGAVVSGTANLDGDISNGLTYGKAPLNYFGPDGNGGAQFGQSRNLVFNANGALYTPPTTSISSFASAARANVNDSSGALQLCPTGWSQGFESAGAGAGCIQQLTNALANSGLGTAYGINIVDGSGHTNNCAFAAVCDAFPVQPSVQYRFSAKVNPGFGTGIPTHGQWYFRVLWYTGATTDFSRASATLISTTDIVAASTTSGLQTPTSVLTAPATAGFCRIAFYHWWDGTSVASFWNFFITDVNCALLNSTDNSSRVNAQNTAATSPLSVTGSATATINIASHTLQLPTGAVTYNSGSITGLSPATVYYVYADDPNFKGGAVTYQASTSKLNPISAETFYYVGWITTNNAGGTGGGGGGGSCTVRGTDLMTKAGQLSNEVIYDAFVNGTNEDACWLDTGDRDEHGRPIYERLKRFEWAPVDSTFTVNVHGFRQFKCSETHACKTPLHPKVNINKCPVGWPLWTKDGWRSTTFHRNDRDGGEVAAIELTGPRHTYLVVDGVWTHNLKPI